MGQNRTQHAHGAHEFQIEGIVPDLIVKLPEEAALRGADTVDENVGNAGVCEKIVRDASGRFRLRQIGAECKRVLHAGLCTQGRESRFVPTNDGDAAPLGGQEACNGAANPRAAARDQGKLTLKLQIQVHSLSERRPT
jgi:hypothetical protein